MHTPKNIQPRMHQGKDISRPPLRHQETSLSDGALNHKILVQPLRVHRCTCACVRTCVCVDFTQMHLMRIIVHLAFSQLKI